MYWYSAYFLQINNQEKFKHYIVWKEKLSPVLFVTQKHLCLSVDTTVAKIGTFKKSIPSLNVTKSFFFFFVNSVENPYSMSGCKQIFKKNDQNYLIII